MQLTRRSSTSRRAAQRNEPVGAPDRHDRFTARGAETVARLRQVLREGNVLRIWIKDEEGRTLIEIPALLGVRGGARLIPISAAVGALASVSGELTVEVSREEGWPRYAEP